MIIAKLITCGTSASHICGTAFPLSTLEEICRIAMDAESVEAFFKVCCCFIPNLVVEVSNNSNLQGIRDQLVTYRSECQRRDVDKNTRRQWAKQLQRMWSELLHQRYGVASIEENDAAIDIGLRMLAVFDTVSDDLNYSGGRNSFGYSGLAEEWLRTDTNLLLDAQLVLNSLPVIERRQDKDKQSAGSGKLKLSAKNIWGLLVWSEYFGCSVVFRECLQRIHRWLCPGEECQCSEYLTRQNDKGEIAKFGHLPRSATEEIITSVDQADEIEVKLRSYFVEFSSKSLKSPALRNGNSVGISHRKSDTLNTSVLSEDVTPRAISPTAYSLPRRFLSDTKLTKKPDVDSRNFSARGSNSIRDFLVEASEGPLEIGELNTADSGEILGNESRHGYSTSINSYHDHLLDMGSDLDESFARFSKFNEASRTEIEGPNSRPEGYDWSGNGPKPLESRGAVDSSLERTFNDSGRNSTLPQQFAQLDPVISRITSRQKAVALPGERSSGNSHGNGQLSRDRRLSGSSSSKRTETTQSISSMSASSKDGSEEAVEEKPNEIRNVTMTKQQRAQEARERAILRNKLAKEKEKETKLRQQVELELRQSKLENLEMQTKLSRIGLGYHRNEGSKRSASAPSALRQHSFFASQSSRLGRSAILGPGGNQGKASKSRSSASSPSSLRVHFQLSSAEKKHLEQQRRKEIEEKLARQIEAETSRRRANLRIQRYRQEKSDEKKWQEEQAQKKELMKWEQRDRKIEEFKQRQQKGRHLQTENVSIRRNANVTTTTSSLDSLDDRSRRLQTTPNNRAIAGNLHPSFSPAALAAVGLDGNEAIVNEDLIPPPPPPPFPPPMPSSIQHSSSVPRNFSSLPPGPSMSDSQKTNLDNVEVATEVAALIDEVLQGSPVRPSSAQNRDSRRLDHRFNGLNGSHTIHQATSCMSSRAEKTTVSSATDSYSVSTAAVSTTSIRVVRAVGLKEPLGGCHPYVILDWGTLGRASTHTIRNSTEPRFGAVLKFKAISSGDGEALTEDNGSHKQREESGGIAPNLRVYVYSKNASISDELIGESFVNGSEVLLAGQTGQLLTAHLMDSHQSQSAGFVEMEVK